MIEFDLCKREKATRQKLFLALRVFGSLYLTVHKLETLLSMSLVKWNSLSFVRTSSKKSQRGTLNPSQGQQIAIAVVPKTLLFLKKGTENQLLYF